MYVHICCSGERDDWGTERQKLLDAVQVEKKQWHEEREQLMKNWAEESEILTQVYCHINHRSESLTHSLSLHCVCDCFGSVSDWCVVI